MTGFPQITNIQHSRSSCKKCKWRWRKF